MLQHIALLSRISGLDPTSTLGNKLMEKVKRKEGMNANIDILIIHPHVFGGLEVNNVLSSKLKLLSLCTFTFTTVKG